MDELAPVPGIVAIALGGSYARGWAVADSDLDLGLFYLAASPPSIPALRQVAARFHEGEELVLTELFGWGPWVNGGAWLTIRGQRVDLIYRGLEDVERVIDDAEQGRYESHFDQQPPFGFFGPTYLGEIACAVPLYDPAGRLARLQARVAAYPEALRQRVVADALWSTDFALSAFASKFARRGEVYLVASTLARCTHALILALFALNRRYFVNDKTALREIAGFPLCPREFRARVEGLFAAPGASFAQLGLAVREMRALRDEVAALAGGLATQRPPSES